MLTLLRRLVRLRRDEDGSPAIEMVFAAPALFLICAGTIELGMIMFVTVLMESSLRDAARYGITGQVEDGFDREAYIVELIGERTLGLVDLATADLNILSYPTFDDVGRGETFVDGNGNGVYDAGETFTDENGNGLRDDDVGVPGAGESGQVVVYRISYQWPLLTPLIGPLIGQDGKYEIRASIAVRNEPWETEA
ncbi:MAG: TadE/TadG family type IV pilus assembly protein [Rhodospirillales bacterium]